MVRKANAELLAKRFVELLKKEIGVKKFEVVRSRNGTLRYVSCCASHDFCDANMVMLAAYCEVKQINEADVDVNDEQVIEVFNVAWNIAREEYLTRER